MFVRETWRAAGVRHGFLDATESAPDRNWRQSLASLGVDAPVVTPKQVHGPRALRVTDDRPPGEADALITTRTGLAIGVVTADCVPILLREPGSETLGVVHAGWRGAASGVIEAAVRELVDASGASPASIEAAIGPAIGRCCYQVGPEVRTTFEQLVGDPACESFVPDGHRFRLDLRDAAYRLLVGAGVTNAEIVGPCTRCTATLHSYRRDGGAGRQLSFILGR